MGIATLESGPTPWMMHTKLFIFYEAEYENSLLIEHFVKPGDKSHPKFNNCC